MKFLFDQNLSHHLIAALQSDLAGSLHVRDLQLERSDDETIWNVAKEQGFTIISKDADFHQRSLLFGHPPKVVWLRVGNLSTHQIQEILQTRIQDLRDFHADHEASLLIISQ